MFRNLIYIFILIISLSSCASLPAMQSRVNRLAAKGDFQYAAHYFSEMPEGSYGKNNRLIEALDRGMIFHYAGRYRRSIEFFEEAKKIYDELYTKSLSKIAASWLWNDSSLPYPGEDFERAMINVFQALNFLALGEHDEALVEARNASSVLQALNDRYPKDLKNVYRDDAFVRMLAGILYESLGERNDLNDALIDYRKALKLYETSFLVECGIAVPEVLKENFLSVSQWMGDDELSISKRRFQNTKIYSIKERAGKGELYVIVYRGQIVNKVEGTVVLPGMDGLLTRISFPRYRKNFKSDKSVSMKVVSEQEKEQMQFLNKAQDMDVIARLNLDNRRTRILAKAVARPVTKQLFVETAEDYVVNKAGKEAGQLFNIAGQFYLLYSEQADLRSWGTLPSEIYLGRFILEPGNYRLFVDAKPVTSIEVSAGQKKFITYWFGY
ncbi:MAG: hypothetical protein AB1650_05565 [Candidatus Omnitrophota bacterium]